jgi:hypothetical protein
MGSYWWIQEEMVIMEDYVHSSFVETRCVQINSQSYANFSSKIHEKNSWLTVQLANLKVVRMYKNGASQMAMMRSIKNFKI